MRVGETTLQKLRINKSLKKKKEVALDLMKIFKEIEDGGIKSKTGEFAEKKLNNMMKPGTEPSIGKSKFRQGKSQSLQRISSKSSMELKEKEP